VNVPSVPGSLGQEESGRAAEQIPKVGDEKCDGVIAVLAQNDLRLSPFGEMPLPHTSQKTACVGHPPNGKMQPLQISSLAGGKSDPFAPVQEKPEGAGPVKDLGQDAPLVLASGSVI
jgi:hypothetical protein